MGQAGAKAREVKGKPKTGRRITQQKIESAKNTGILSLKESKLSKIPSEVWELQQLKTLDLSFNQLSVISDSVGALKNVKTLNLRGNQLTSLPDLSNMISLTKLILDENQLETLGPLPANLQKLTLSRNRLRRFPQLNTPSLQVLDLSHNLIESIASLQFPELEELNLDQNQLQCLPEGSLECPRLKTLSLRDNRIAGTINDGKQSLPSSVLADSKIQVLNLDRNPLTKLEFVAMKGADGFLERRKQLKDKGIQGGLPTDASICGLD